MRHAMPLHAQHLRPQTLRPQTLRPQRLRRVLPPLAVGAFALWLYASTAAPWLTWAHDGADGGDLIAAAMTLGVPHPSGYPTYCLLARLYALLPLGAIARRFNLFSATSAAATVVLVYLAARWALEQSATRRAPWGAALGALAALACASGYTLWSQATITEVYTLQAFFFALSFYLALREDWLLRARAWAILGMSLGLGLGAHLALLLALPGTALLLWPRASARRLLALAAGLGLGLSVYAYLPLAAQGPSPVVWGQPDTWAGFWWMVSGKLYRGYLLAVPLDVLPSRLAAWARLWGQQYTWPGLALGLGGLYSWAAQGRRRWVWGTSITFLSYTLYALTYNTTDSYVYLIPAFLLAAVWLAEGAGVVLSAGARWATRGTQPPNWQHPRDSLVRPHAPPGAIEGENGRGGRSYPQRACCARFRASPTRNLFALGLIILALIPAWSILAHYRALDLCADGEVAGWVEDSLRQLPQAAVLISSEDRHTFALEYVQWVDGRRGDLLVADGELLSQPWYVAQLKRRLPGMGTLGGALSPAQFAAVLDPQHALYLDSPREELARHGPLVPRGPLWEVTAPR